MLPLNKIHFQPNSQTHTFCRKKREQKINPRVSFTPGLSISSKQKQREKVARLKNHLLHQLLEDRLAEHDNQVDCASYAPGGSQLPLCFRERSLNSRESTKLRIDACSKTHVLPLNEKERRGEKTGRKKGRRGANQNEKRRVESRDRAAHCLRAD